MFALEVKAGATAVGSSLAAFARRHGIGRALRLSPRGFHDDGWLRNTSPCATGQLLAFLQAAEVGA